jgi:hypothetical protein
MEIVVRRRCIEASRASTLPGARDSRIVGPACVGA